MGIANRSLSPPTTATSNSGSKRQRHASPVVPTPARPLSPFTAQAPPHAAAHIAHPSVAGPPNHPLPSKESLPFLLVCAAPIAAAEEVEHLIGGTTAVQTTGGFSASFGCLIACTSAPPPKAPAKGQGQRGSAAAGAVLAIRSVFFHVP